MILAWSSLGGQLASCPGGAAAGWLECESTESRGLFPPKSNEEQLSAHRERSAARPPTCDAFRCTFLSLCWTSEGDSSSPRTRPLWSSSGSPLGPGAAPAGSLGRLQGALCDCSGGAVSRPGAAAFQAGASVTAPNVSQPQLVSRA